MKLGFSSIRQPSQFRRPWRMLPDRRRQYDDRSALLLLGTTTPPHSRIHGLSIQVVNAHHGLCRCLITKNTLQKQGAFSRVKTKLGFSSIKQPSRLRRPWRMLPDRRRQYDDRSALLLLGTTTPPHSRIHGLSIQVVNAHHGLCRCLITKNTLQKQGAFSRVKTKLGFSSIKQPSRLRRPWRMLPDRRRPYRREPCGSSGCWPWKACK